MPIQIFVIFNIFYPRSSQALSPPRLPFRLRLSSQDHCLPSAVSQHPRTPRAVGGRGAVVYGGLKQGLEAVCILRRTGKAGMTGFDHWVGLRR